MDTKMEDGYLRREWEQRNGAGMTRGDNGALNVIKVQYIQV